ncbi:hypothetical protein [Thalassospira lohafexi]|uniref:Uncharacterized protein n=1 Tax=Thalassospira lohafexi TaxID=744227 RepID=A0A2N3L901_9PROT|nr:hypothetical protein [Thalassospira lohafexi]PKR59295.1 hypothetical protein COO92_04415 [Thalassospira lohafexi]
MNKIAIFAFAMLLVACQKTTTSNYSDSARKYIAKDIDRVSDIILATCVEHIGDIDAINLAIENQGGIYVPDQDKTLKINDAEYRSLNYYFLKDGKFYAGFSVTENGKFCTTAFPKEAYVPSELLGLLGAQMFDGSFKGAQVGYVGKQKLPLLFIPDFKGKTANDMVMVMDQDTYRGRQNFFGSPDID